jgi:iron complex transport system ATP-binding protein
MSADTGSDTTARPGATDRPAGSGRPATDGTPHLEVPSNGMTLSCRDVRVTYGRFEALGGVDLHLEGGEWLGLIGPNGAGKTTLIGAIGGLIDHDGEVALGDGRKPGARDIALVPQTPLLPPGMTVAEYVLLGRTAHLGWLARETREDRRIAATAVRRLGLQAFGERIVTTLSGGEAQRMVVARALAQQAPVLLLDEPTSSLDLGHQVAVLELVDELRREDGLSVISAMHDLSTAARFCDRLALIAGGQLIAQGTPDEVLQADRLSSVYETPLTVRHIDGELCVLPIARHRHA